MNETTFQTLVRYGSIVIAVALILNVYVVMRHVEVYRDAARAEAGVQKLMIQQQAIQAVLQDFYSRAPNDPEIAGIFKRAQAVSGAASGVSSMTNQPLPPSAPTGEAQ